MKRTTMHLFSGILIAGTLLSCNESYDKTPEDWSAEICKCASEKGADAKECQDRLKELKDYYSEDDYAMHDKATTLVGQDCPDVLFVDMDE